MKTKVQLIMRVMRILMVKMKKSGKKRTQKLTLFVDEIGCLFFKLLSSLTLSFLTRYYLESLL